MELSELNQRIIAEIDEKDTIEEQATKVHAAYEALKRQQSYADYKNNAFQFGQYLSLNYKRLSHLVHFKINGDRINTDYYNSREIAARMLQRDTYPEYQDVVFRNIKKVIGFIPKDYQGFAENELSLRHIFMRMEEDGRFDTAIFHELIRRLFSKAQDMRSDDKKFHEEAKVKLAEYRNSNPENENTYSRGFQTGYFTAKHNTRLAYLMQYYINLHEEVKLDYGSERLNQFMRHPQNLPEYGDFVRKNIEEIIGYVPWGHEKYASIELCLRHFFFNVFDGSGIEKKLLEDVIKRLFKDIGDVPEEVDRQKLN